MVATELTELLNRVGGSSFGLFLSTSGVVGCDRFVATLIEAFIESLDCSRRDGELGGHVVRVRVGRPALKKSSGGWEQEEHVA